jgi:hypothetical protein
MHKAANACLGLLILIGTNFEYIFPDGSFWSLCGRGTGWSRLFSLIDCDL